MFLFETDHVHELHFTEGGNVVGDANGFTADDFPAENILEAAEWVAPKHWINVDDLAASPADVDDSDEYDTDFDLTKDEAGEPVLVFHRATRREVTTFETPSFVWPSQDESNDEIEDNELYAEIDEYFAVHGHFPPPKDDLSDEGISLPYHSAVTVRDTMSSSRYSDFTQNRDGNYTRGSGTKWKTRKPCSARERKLIARHAA